MTSRGPECLDDDTVIGFLEGTLSAEARATANAHVDRCPACLALVAAVGRSVPKPALEGSERYALRTEVGTGGMGQVFKAFDAVLGREVALKCVRSGPEDLAAAKRFEREMALTARLQHPSIIPVYDAGSFPDGTRYFAMRLVDGRTLERAIEEATTFDARMALVPAIRRACEAVAYAHQQSVIHRDLKPANVLIGPFGETVVLDWGLAKHLLEADVDGDSVQPDDEDPEGMTRAGSVMGTPGYIAPEVSRGEPADRRADVFSLGKVLQALTSGVAAEARGEVLADIRAIATRATAPEAVDRYADAGELCDDLRRFEGGQTVGARDYSVRSRVRRFTRRHRGTIMLSGSFVAVGGLVGVIATTLVGDDADEPCSGADEALAGAWDDARRGEVRAAFEASERPYAVSAYERAERALDGYAERWIGMHQSACEATANGEQSAALLDLRMACLSRRATELQASVDVLASADPTVVDKADELVRLRPLDPCEDRNALEAVVEPPRPEETAAVDAARAELARGDALRKAAQFEAATEAVDQARVALADVAYEPVQTELALTQGLLFVGRGEYDDAERTLERAIRLGTRWRQWEDVRVAVGQQMVVLSSKQLRPDEALRLRPLAEGLSNGSPLAEAQMHARLATVLNVDGNYAAAAAEHEAALAIHETLGDPVGVATSRNNYGISLKNLGKLKEAESELREAVRVDVEVLGSEHPTTAMARSNLASVLDELGKPEESEAEARKALEAQLRVLPTGHLDIAASHVQIGHALFSQGKYEESEAEYRAGLAGVSPDHPHVGSARHSLGNALVARKQYAEAAAEYRAALEVFSSTVGPDHPRAETARLGIGNALFLSGEYEQAEAEYRALLDARAKRTPVNPLKLATAHSSVSNALFGQGRHDDAADELRSALALYIQHLEPDHPYLARTRHNLANVLLDAGRAADALPYAELAWERRRAKTTPVEKRASTAFLLARILWTAKGDRKRALELAETAKSDFAEAGHAHDGMRGNVEVWLAERAG